MVDGNLGLHNLARPTLVDLREEVRWLRENYQAIQERVCGLMQIAVSSFRYRTSRSDEALRERLVELARKKPRFGYRRLHVFCCWAAGSA